MTADARLKSIDRIERCNRHGYEFRQRDGCPECLELQAFRLRAVNAVRYAVVLTDAHESGSIEPTTDLS